VGLDQLLARMRQENADQIAAVLAQARADAADTQRAEETRRLGERSRRLAALKERLRTDQTARMEALRREQFHHLLSAQHRTVERVLSRVEEFLPQLEEDPEYLRRIEIQLQDGLAMLSGRPARLTLSPAFRAYLADRVPSGVEVRSKPGATGFQLVSEDGRIEVIGTAVEQVQRTRPALRIAALRALTRDGSP